MNSNITIDSDIIINSEITLTQLQMKEAVIEYLAKNGVSVRQVNSITQQFDGYRSEDPSGFKLNVVLGSSNNQS